MTTCAGLFSPHLGRRYWFHRKVIHSFSLPSTTLEDPLSSGLSNWDIHHHNDLREEYDSRRKDLLLFVGGRQFLLTFLPFLSWTWWICCSLVFIDKRFVPRSAEATTSPPRRPTSPPHIAPRHLPRPPLLPPPIDDNC